MPYGKLLFNPIPAIEALLAIGIMTLALILSWPPYDTLIAQGLGAFHLVMAFCAGAFTSGALTIAGLWKNSRTCRKLGTAGMFLVMSYLSFLLLVLAAGSTGIWAITLSSSLIAGICYITEKAGLP